MGDEAATNGHSAWHERHPGVQSSIAQVTKPCAKAVQEVLAQSPRDAGSDQELAFCWCKRADAIDAGDKLARKRAKKVAPATYAGSS